MGWPEGRERPSNFGDKGVQPGTRRIHETDVGRRLFKLKLKNPEELANGEPGLY